MLTFRETLSLAAVMSLATTTACSSSSSSGAAAGAGGSSGNGAGAAGGSGGSGNGGASTAGTGGAATGGSGATRIGGIDVTQAAIAGGYHYGISAGFAKLPTSSGAGGASATEVVTTIGPCYAAVITSTASGAGGAPSMITPLSAGQIVVTGSGIPASATLTFGPIGMSGYSGYAQASGDTKLFAPGDMLVASASGSADVPAFTTPGLVAPNELTVTSPACTGGCPPLDRTQDLQVAWTGGGAGKMVVTFETISDPTTVLLECHFDASAGMGVVPAALLGKLGKAGEGDVTGVLLIRPISSIDVPVGTGTVTFTIQSAALESMLAVSK
jgi:hypothetical protein